MKKLGQYFLKSKNNLQKIVESLELKPDDTIIEIGPGHGELTENLGTNFKIIAIEKDEKLVCLLKKKFKLDKNIEIVEGDALKTIAELTKKLKTKIYKIVGNIPYYITGYLLRIFGELENKPSLIVLILQKEVGERICAQPPKMNLLAASIQFWAKPQIISYIPKTDFRPQPKVDSVIIRFKPITLPGRSSTKCNKNNEKKYYKLIKILFKQPRKTILNNLRKIKDKEKIIKILEELELTPGNRPQNLTIEQIKKLAAFF
jgi:16S rRNA (adenine1518-N6/adenine1519-N6)-dimethyltransferase